MTSYIESASGVAVGGRTGLASVVTGLLFIAALFFSPLVNMIGGGFKTEEGAMFYPVTAPALKLFSGRGKEVSWLIYLLAVIFILRSLYIKSL